MKKDYPSRVDVWLAATMIAAPTTSVVVGVINLSKSNLTGVIAISSGVLVGGLIAALAIPCVYTLSDDNLKIRSGLIEEDIPLRRIRSVQKSHALWSAPALSLRRVKITLDDGYRLISPREREQFIADIQARLRATSPAERVGPAPAADSSSPGDEGCA